MKVLITGAKGQLGRALMATAPRHTVLASADIDECDLTDSDAICSLVQRETPDLVINAAAYTAVDKAEEDEVTAQAINSDAVAALVGAHAGKLVHVSTDFVFDGKSSRAYRPQDERNPVSVYGHTKAGGEDHLRDSDILVRTAWVYTAGGANFVRTMLRLMAEKPALNVVCDQIGAPTWAPGLATTIWGLVAEEATGTFHHSDSGVASWYDFAVAIQEEAIAEGLLRHAIPINPVPTTAYPTPASRPAFSLLDSSKTRELLQDSHTHWRVNLRKMLKEETALG